MVNLGADIAATLPFLRAQANSRMTETFVFFTVALVEVEGTLGETAVETVVKTTVGRLKFASVQAHVVESANQYAVLQQLEIHIPTPTSAPLNIPVGCMARCTASSADVSLVGREFRVTGRPKAGQTTAHRYPVEEVS